MRTIRIYQAGAYDLNDWVELSSGASLHVARVLRMHVGDVLTLFCGDNRAFAATIMSVDKRRVVVRIDAIETEDREAPRAIHLAQALSKGERMEFVVQKAVELGVTSITPLFTDHCVVRLDADRLLKKHHQWQAILIAACEQSGRNFLPTIHPACTFDDYLLQCQSSIRVILHPGVAAPWREVDFKTIGDIALVIGPEGGLSAREVALAETKQFQARSLGPRILRTETATIAALSVLQAMVGDF